MKIKDYKCKCGHNDFFFADKGKQKGIYCSYCGKWLKWADKDEQNLAMKQEPSYNSVESKLKNPKAKTFDILHFVADNAGLSTFEAIEKAYNMGVSEQESVIDKIRAEIDKARFIDKDTRMVKNMLSSGLEVAMRIIDKYKAEEGEG